MNDYIVIWKDAPGQQVSTVVDAHDQPARRDWEYIVNNSIPVIDNEDKVIAELAVANGEKFAVPTQVARDVLGWDV